MSFLRFCTLFSGSSGNCTYAEDNGTAILIDAGCNCKCIENALSSFGQEMKNIRGIFITHEHSDHISALKVLSKKYKKNIFGTKATLEKIAELYPEINSDLFIPFEAGDGAELFDFRVVSFKTPHDSCCSVGYVIESSNKKIAVATDMGHITQEFLRSTENCDYILLEDNYDEMMLEYNQNYPIVLKRRIAGDFGHLSNRQSAQAILKILENGTQKIILGHLSEQNNTPQQAMKSINMFLSQKGIKNTDLSLGIAPRHDVSEVICV